MNRRPLPFAALTVFASLALVGGCSKPADQAPANTPAAGAPATAPAQPGSQPAPAADTPPAATPAATPAAGAMATPPPAAAAAPLAPAPPPALPRTFTLAAGTALKVRTTTEVSTKDVKAGDTFSATLASPIVDGDWAIAGEGAKVTGVVVDADEGGRVKGVASLTVALQTLELSNGKTIDLSTSSYGVKSKSEAKKDAATIGIGAAAGAGVGAIVGGGKGAAVGAAVGGGGAAGVKMATRGKPAAIGAGATITFKLKEPVTVTK